MGSLSKTILLRSKENEALIQGKNDASKQLDPWIEPAGVDLFVIRPGRLFVH